MLAHPLHRAIGVLLLFTVEATCLLSSQTHRPGSQAIHKMHAATTAIRGRRDPGLVNVMHRFNVAAVKWTMNNPSTPSMSVFPDALVSSGSWFSVTWSGVENPNYDDFVALYVPADANISAVAPVKMQFCAQANADHVLTGSGVARFWLINYRQDMVFVLMRGGMDTPVAVARSDTVRVLNPNEPLQGHLARTQDPSEMVVQWTSHNSSRPEVRWGPSHGTKPSHMTFRDLPYTATASSSSYSREDMCGSVAASVGWMEPGSQHHALLTGLQSGRRYSYSFGDEAWGFSQVFSFMAAPLPDESTHILATADVGTCHVDGSNSLMGNMLASLNTTTRLAAEGPEFSLLLHNGDLSYAEGFSSEWDNFFHQMAPVASSMPYMVAVGNHERDWPGAPFDRWQVDDSGGECGVPYERRLLMPTQGQDQPWYSFRHGPVHFIQYSTEHFFTPGSAQYDWIVSELQRVDRSVTPWLVLGGHRPIYISSTNHDLPDGDQVVAQGLRSALEPLLMRFKVDLTLHGHHHTYQRTCPVVNETCVGLGSGGHALGPVHVVMGNGGAPLSMNIQNPPPRFLVKSQPWWGYLRLHVSTTELHVEAVSDDTGGLIDEFKLYKPRNWGDDYMRGQRHWERM